MKCVLTHKSHGYIDENGERRIAVQGETLDVSEKTFSAHRDRFEPVDGSASLVATEALSTGADDLKSAFEGLDNLTDMRAIVDAAAEIDPAFDNVKNSSKSGLTDEFMRTWAASDRQDLVADLLGEPDEDEDEDDEDGDDE